MQIVPYFEGVSARSVIDQIARQRGWDPVACAPSLEEQERMCQLANQALVHAWRFAPWPFLALTRRVAYRPDWEREPLLAYVEGDQVFHAGRYYEALRDEPQGEPGESRGGDWEACERSMVCGISYVRYGIDEIDLARGVFTLDPDRRADAVPLRASRVAFGAVVQQEPGRPFCARPFVRYRPVPPRLCVSPWREGVAYAPGDLVLGADGEAYEAQTRAVPGLAPSLSREAALKVWAVQRCPRLFESYVVQSAAAELATDDNMQAARRAQVEKELQFLAESCLRQLHGGERAATRVLR